MTDPVLIVDDHPVVRRGLRTLLENEPWVSDVLEAGTVADAVRQAVTARAPVVAMDLMLPDGDGVDATRRILRTCPDARILILTMTHVDTIVDSAIQAGARGFLLKDTPPEMILDALRTVAAGGVALGPTAGSHVLAAVSQSAGELPPPLNRLTARERDMLCRLTVGDTNAKIARHLGLSEKTVRNQLSGVFAKIGVSGRVEAALLARDAGLRPPPPH